ncbi:hypothetical protein NC653_000300 [Populus alba x Populus x berolinensis]|uniref:Uncharacterized protein n=1 Tax=Populus alba x Populus x berolinensis TaxID=444605 RepID=A0AAD6RJF8_9ROSI|nr:hypothetical protein NC653_000300 [Populus alba x Populus x berolinensis]
MGRGRGKGKKLTVSNHDDTGSGEEEKIPAQKRRGRPQKPLKDDIDEEEVEKIEDEEVENGKTGITSKETKSPTAAENGKKRKRYSQAKEKPDSVKEENGVGTRSSTDDSTKSNGFRHNRSRRKNKPRRAAEAGVECQLCGCVYFTRNQLKFVLSGRLLYAVVLVKDKRLEIVHEKLPRKSVFSDSECEKFEWIP